MSKTLFSIVLQWTFVIFITKTCRNIWNLVLSVFFCSTVSQQVFLFLILQLQFGGEGGGDFLKTTSGHRRTEVPSDPDTRCGSLSYRHPHPMRYANSKENALDLKAALGKVLTPLLWQRVVQFWRNRLPPPSVLCLFFISLFSSERCSVNFLFNTPLGRCLGACIKNTIRTEVRTNQTKISNVCQSSFETWGTHFKLDS